MRLLRNCAVALVLTGTVACGAHPRTSADGAREPADRAGATATWQIVLAQTEPRNGDDLRQLANWLGDARIVGLGENVHGTHELHRLAHRMFAQLVQEQGFGVFALEVDAAHGMLIDEFVQGERDDLDAILAGGWWASAAFYDQALRDLLGWMRDYNRTAAERVHFAGYDAKQSGLAIELLQRELRDTEPAAAVEIGRLFADVEALGHLGVFPNVYGYSAPLEISVPGGTVAASRPVRVSLRLRGSDVTFGKIGFHLRAAGVPTEIVTVDGSELGPGRVLEGSIDLPAEATEVTLTVFHRGNGTVWFEDLVATLDGDVLPADLAQAEAVALLMPELQRLDYTAEAELWSSSALRVTCDQRVTIALASAAQIAAIVERYLARRPLDPASAKVRQLAQVVVQAARWRTLAEPNRDVFLSDNLGWLADQIYPGKRIVALAHTSHSEKVRERMGEFLAAKRGEGYRTVSMLAQTGTYRYFPPPSRMPTGGLPEMEVLPLTPQSLRPLDRVLGGQASGDAMIRLRDNTALRASLGEGIDLDRLPDVVILVGTVTPARSL